jgi:hypothetical protein
MIILFIYFCILSIFFADWLYFVVGIGHRYMTWIPEFMALLAFLYIPAAMALKKEFRLPPKYTLLIILYIVHIGTGFVVNSMEVGTIIAGSRQFFKFIPIFLLPSVVELTENDIIRILKFIFLMAVIQFPVTIWQRFFGALSHSGSGDHVSGTIGEFASGRLSIFLIIVLSFFIILLLWNRISLKFFMVSFFLLFIPTAINETKITFLLLPFAFILPVYFGKIKLGKNLSKIVPLILFASIVLFIFVGIYNYIGWGKSKGDLLGFFSQTEKISKYSDNRIVPILTAFEKIFDNEIKITVFGYGAGNLSPSFNKSMESNFVEKFSVYQPLAVTLTKLLWETGYGGITLFSLILVNIFFDALKLFKRSEGFFKMFALWMTVVTCFFSLSNIYSAILDSNLFMYLFFFFSGYLVSYERYHYKSINLHLKN